MYRHYVLCFHGFLHTCFCFLLGLVILRDPRVSEANNNVFLDMMERYFESSDGITDARPHYHYQVGVTPSHIGIKTSQSKLLFN